jgi:hypothetical protein
VAFNVTGTPTAYAGGVVNLVFRPVGA